MMFTVRKVAGELDMSTGRVYEIIRKGWLRGVRIGRQIRVDEAELRRFKESGQPLPPRDDA